MGGKEIYYNNLTILSFILICPYLSYIIVLLHILICYSYRGGMISTRAKAMLRKHAIIDGTYGTFQPYVGGWDPAWDTHKKVTDYCPT